MINIIKTIKQIAVLKLKDTYLISFLEVVKQLVFYE